MSKENGETPDASDNISEFPLREGDPEEESEFSEFLVDIETHSAIVVIARNVEEAATKALSDDDDIQQVIVSHDVHVCVHSGISDNECDHKEEAE